MVLAINILGYASLIDNFAYKNDTTFADELHNFNANQIINQNGAFARAFPINPINDTKNVDLNAYEDLIELSNNFQFGFENAGLMRDGIVCTVKTTPVFETPTPLSNIVQVNVDNHFFLNQSEINKFNYLRGSKKIPRQAPDGSTYMYSEGAMSPFDDLTLPERTMLTSEGSINRSTHIVKDSQNNQLRILTPVECERLNQFPDDWTNTGMPEKRRYFMMGNALVCGVISRLGTVIENIIENER